MVTAISIVQDDLWLQYFDRRAAVEALFTHVAGLPSSRTEEKHTVKVYRAGIQYFLDWAGDALPTPDLMSRFIGHLVQRNLKSSTISSKYLAPVRLYLRRLAAQSIRVTGAEREFVSDCREQIRQAADIPSPKPGTVSNIPALWRPEFNRLNIQQVNATLRQIDREQLAGLRDYALLLIAFSTALRLAELSRITLDSITPTDDDGYLLTVRGKRNNTDPVPISSQAYAALTAWVDAYNADLDADDPRYITPNRPVWQPLHSGTTRFAPDRIAEKDAAIAARYPADAQDIPLSGVSHQSLRDIIANRTAAALGDRWKLAAHDTRRTAAAIAYEAGMPLPDIQALLRHKSAAVTLNYIGTKPDFHKRDLSTYVQFG